MRKKKPKAEKQDKTVSTRVTAAQKRAIERLARQAKLSEGQYLYEGRRSEIEQLTNA